MVDDYHLRRLVQAFAWHRGWHNFGVEVATSAAFMLEVGIATKNADTQSLSRDFFQWVLQRMEDATVNDEDYELIVSFYAWARMVLLKTAPAHFYDAHARLLARA